MGQLFIGAGVGAGVKDPESEVVKNRPAPQH